MVDSSTTRNKRIAKNTLLLYVRTIVIMIISLFTSRLTLEVLGVDNYGIYNVVGGFVGMMSIISGTITSSISRYLTFGLGKGDLNELNRLFSTSLNVLFALSAIILIIGESFGLWFIFHKLNIPSDRVYAAHWVFQCSLLSFIVNLINVPYNASIISHEKMGVFAYMTLLDVGIKLIFVYCLFITPFDVLITYSVLLCLVGIMMRLIYGSYCARHFEECHYSLTFDKGIFKEMAGFAGWNFLGNTAYILNTQGVNMTINIFFGVALNAARGVVGQVEGAVMTLVNNFTVAFTPQITKSYAEGNLDYMYSIVCRGTKFSIFLLLYILIPLSIESNTVLHLWLKDVPPQTSEFLILTLICNASLLMGSAAYTAIMATGNIRNYQISVTLIACLIFPLTWLSYKLGYPASSTYYIYMSIYIILVFYRMKFLRKLLKFPIKMYFTESILPIILVSIVAAIIPLYISRLIDDGISRLIIVVLASIITTSATIYLIGFTKNERKSINGKIITILSRIRDSL